MICKLNRFLALCVALMLALGCFAAVAEEPATVEEPIVTEEPSATEEADDNPVLITVDGTDYTLSEVNDTLNQLISAGYASEND